MNPLKAWGLSVAVLAGTGVPVALAADAPAASKPAESAPWYKRVFGSKPKPDVKPAVTQPLSPEAMAEAVDAEQKAYLRRLEVCTELRRVADERRDEALLRQVDELEQQAKVLYNQRTAALGVKRATGPAATAVLDHKLGTGAEVTPLTVSDSKPADATRTAQLRGVRR